MNKIESFIIEKCKLKNIKLSISNRERVVIDGIECNGYFNYKNGAEIIIAKGGKSDFDFYSLLLHEFCHAIQYLENDSSYMKLIKLDKDIDEIVDDWLNFKIEISEKELKRYVYLLLDVELDCEKRVVKLIKDNNFNLDLDTYIKKGNSYLLFY